MPDFCVRKMSRFGNCVWPFTAGQTKVQVVLLLVVAGLVLLSHLVKVIDDGSTTTGQEALDAVTISSTGK